MNEFERLYRKRFFVLCGCLALVLMALAFGMVNRVLSPREFGFIAIFLWIGMFIGIMRIIKLYRKSDAEFREKQIAQGLPAQSLDRERYTKSVRSLKRLIGLMTVLLAYGLWNTQGQALMPRLVGTGVDLFIILLAINSLLRARRKLQNL